MTAQAFPILIGLDIVVPAAQDTSLIKVLATVLESDWSLWRQSHKLTKHAVRIPTLMESFALATKATPKIPVENARLMLYVPPTANT